MERIVGKGRFPLLADDAALLYTIGNVPTGSKFSSIGPFTESLFGIFALKSPKTHTKPSNHMKISKKNC